MYHWKTSCSVSKEDVKPHPRGLQIISFRQFENVPLFIVPVLFNGDVNTDYFFCRLCNKWLNISSTTGNFFKHIKSMHPDMLNHDEGDSADEPSDEQKIAAAKRLFLLNALPFSLCDNKDFKLLCPFLERHQLSQYASELSTNIRAYIKEQMMKAEAITLVIDEWLIQKDVWIEIVKYLINHFKSEHAYEINGFLIKFVESSEFSLPNLILAIKALHDSYYPKKLFHFKRNNSFVLKRPLIPNTIIKECVQEYGHLPQEEKTQLIGSFDEYKAYLSDGTTNYPLIGETVLIGRSMACDIRIESLEISLKHAKLTRVDDRWYIQDLKSKNKTYLNEKLVQRKMRLKDGMVISFSQKQFTFHEK